MYPSDVLRDLRLPPGRLGTLSKERRCDAIREAVSWPGGQDQSHKTYYVVSKNGEYSVALGKPGKEAAPDYPRPNPNDMTPTVLRENLELGFTPSFYDIFREFQHLGIGDGRVPESSLDLVGCLLFRSAFMLDHEERTPGDRTWRWHPPESVMTYLDSLAPTMGEPPLPTRTFLALIDALAWNEDVKYNPDCTVSGGTGRQNTLLTCANIIGVVLDRVPIYAVFGGMTNARGVCPISQTEARRVFPALIGESYAADNEWRATQRRQP